MNIRVTDGASHGTDQVEPTMAILSDGRILVGWKEAESHNDSGRRVGFAYSTDDEERKGNTYKHSRASFFLLANRI
jgi:hypothetical protein